MSDFDPLLEAFGFAPTSAKVTYRHTFTIDPSDGFRELGAPDVKIASFSATFVPGEVASIEASIIGPRDQVEYVVARLKALESIVVEPEK